MKRLHIAVATLFLFLTPVTVLAWGNEGHQMIVNMAFSLLSPAAKQKMLMYLGGRRLNDAAVWMDSVRSHKVAPYGYMDNWHFVNIEEGQSYNDVQSMDDVVFNLEKVIQELPNYASLPADSVKLDLLKLLHMIGDITQPLHCGYKHDRGGNYVKVHTQIGDFDGNDLHKVWDGEIIHAGHINIQTSMHYYQSLSPAQVSAIQSGSTLDWAMQARSYLKNKVYNFTLAGHGTSQLSTQYLTANAPIVQQQLVYAAIRLANILEKSFGS